MSVIELPIRINQKTYFLTCPQEEEALYAAAIRWVERVAREVQHEQRLQSVRVKSESSFWILLSVKLALELHKVTRDALQHDSSLEFSEALDSAALERLQATLERLSEKIYLL